jgi:Tol biopolymer transport system component
VIGTRISIFTATWSLINICVGQSLIADVQQGTNMALALSPDGQTIAVDLVGQLWELPVTGGAATPVTPIGEPARNPRFSPSGDHLVYQRSTENQWDLWLLDRFSGEQRRLTGPPFNEREPDFAPDGESVLFASDRAGSFDIWEIRLDSGELIQRSRSEGSASFPSTSDRGDVVFVNQRDSIWTLERLQPDGTTVELLSVRHPLRAPSWRPGGGLIIFAEQQTPDTNDLRMILLSEQPVIKTLTQNEDVFGFRPAWLSPGEYLYTADGQIWRRTLANPTRSPVLLFAGVGVTRASHSLRVSGHAPVGIQRAFGIRAARESSSGQHRAFTALGNLWLQGPNNQLQKLTNDVHLDIDPAFTPDGRSLVFASDRAGDMDLWRLSLETNDLAQLTNEEGKSYRPSVSPDGTQVAYLRTAGFGPWSESALELLSLSSGQRTRTIARGLTNADAPVWDNDGNGVSVDTSRPPPGISGPVAAGSLHIDLSSGAEHWTSPSEPAPLDRLSATEPQLPRPVIDWSPAAAEHHYVVQVDKLFDGVRNQYRRHMDIHVKNGRITDVVARGILPLPDIVIDALDYTIIPGLIDVHAHQSALGGERIGRIWLAYGVTTVREVAGVHSDGMERRESWASGQRLGPRLLLTSAAAVDTPLGDSRPDYDIVELYSSQPARTAEPRLEEAISAGLPVFSDQLLPWARLGINGLEHIGSRSERPYGLERSLLNRSYQDVLSILTQTRTVVTPALAAFNGLGGLPGATPRLWSGDAAYTALYHSYERAGWQNASADPATVPALQRTVAELVRAGGRIATGSDAPSVPYGLGLHAELALLSEAGLANDQVLRLATADAALALGLERDLGTLEPGKLADFIVISGDPLTRIADSLRIEATIKNGIWLERRDLLTSP